MKFKCKKCGKVFKRDMRLKASKENYNNGYYISYCEETNTMTNCKKI